MAGLDTDTEYGKLITGTINALNGTVDVKSSNSSLTSIQLSGTWVGSLVAEVSNDGTTWTTVNFTKVSNNLLVNPAIVNDLYIVHTNSYSQVRVRASAWTSGTVTINAFGSDSAISPRVAVGNNSTPLPSQSELIGGSNGTNIIPLKVDDQGRLVTSAVTGFGADFSFGDVATNATAEVAIRRTAYTEQSSNAQRSIVSSSASDSSAGTGARTVKIEYFDSTGAGPFSETITTNGTTAVNTTNTNICFIEKMYVVTVGSNNSNVGTISLKAATAGGGATIGTIAVGNNQTFWCHHYVATGKECNITGVSLSNNQTNTNNGGIFYIKYIPIGVSNSVEFQVTENLTLWGLSNIVQRNYNSPIIIPGPARVTAYVQPAATTAITSRASFDFFEP